MFQRIKTRDQIGFLVSFNEVLRKHNNQMNEIYLRKGVHRKLKLQTPENKVPQQVTTLSGKALDYPVGLDKSS